MKWWKQKHSVCSECGVHFEPVTGYEVRWGNLCAAHRKAVKERDEKRDAVVAWAAANWERVAKMMEGETAEQRAAYNKMMQANIAQMAARQSQQASNYQGPQNGGLGAMVLGGRA
jgi:hypothetical protein